MPNQDLGPSWEDVWDYVNRLQIMWGGTVSLHMRLYHSGKPSRLHGSCRALYAPEGVPWYEITHYGQHGFKGQAGARTAPAAYWFACADLEEKLTAAGSGRQLAMPFEGPGL